MIRNHYLMKQARLEMFKFIPPYAIKPMKIGGTVVRQNIVNSVTGYFPVFHRVLFI